MTRPHEEYENLAKIALKAYATGAKEVLILSDGTTGSVVYRRTKVKKRIVQNESREAVGTLIDLINHLALPTYLPKTRKPVKPEYFNLRLENVEPAYRRMRVEVRPLQNAEATGIELSISYK